VRILVVDDDRVFREELAELLRDDHHEVSAEGSVAKATEQLESSEFDVVLTDLKMPRQGGLDLLRLVRSRWPRTFVVMVTGFATVETALEAMKLGAFDYIRKPFRIEQVRETLRLVAQEREFDAPGELRRDPFQEARDLAVHGRHEVLFFGEPPASPAPHVTIVPLDPESLIGLTDRTSSFVADHANAAVVVAGAERLLERHKLEDVVGAFDRLRGLVAGHGPLRVGFNPRRLPPASAVALGASVSGDEVHETLEALASPIRRKALHRLAESAASFGELMRAAGLDDSPKMSFHLRRLVDSGLVAHGDDEYRLTPRGEASVQLLRDATFLPPPSEASNLAFPKRRGT
jgi:CheY-like chemotaxis protein